MIEFIAGIVAGVALAKKVKAVREWRPKNPWRSKLRIAKYEDGYIVVKQSPLFNPEYYDFVNGTYRLITYSGSTVSLERARKFVEKGEHLEFVD